MAFLWAAQFFYSWVVFGLDSVYDEKLNLLTWAIRLIFSQMDLRWLATIFIRFNIVMQAITLAVRLKYNHYCG